jgi:hypothetical protein
MRKAIVVVVVVGAFASACTGADRPDLSAPRPRTAVDGGAAPVASSCVESYSPDTLIHRSFAFDGTVRDVEVRTDARLPEGEQDVPWVAFEVNRWFRGGSARELGVWVEALNVETSAGAIPAEPGTRLLVAGEPRWGGDPLDDPIAWSCGFTQLWTPEAAAEWEAAFDA